MWHTPQVSFLSLVALSSTFSIRRLWKLQSHHALLLFFLGHFEAPIAIDAVRRLLLPSSHWGAIPERSTWNALFRCVLPTLLAFLMFALITLSQVCDHRSDTMPLLARIRPIGVWLPPVVLPPSDNQIAAASALPKVFRVLIFPDAPLLITLILPLCALITSWATPIILLISSVRAHASTTPHTLPFPIFLSEGIQSSLRERW